MKTRFDIGIVRHNGEFRGWAVWKVHPGCLKICCPKTVAQFFGKGANTFAMKFARQLNRGAKLLLIGLLLAPAAHAWDLKGDRANPVIQDDGDSMAAYSVNVGSSTAQLLFTPRGVKDRRLVICNPTASFLYVSTFSAANATSSARSVVPKGICEDYPPHVQLWALFEAGASTTTVVGFDQYEARD